MRLWHGQGCSLETSKILGKSPSDTSSCFFPSQWAFCCFCLAWTNTASSQSTRPWPRGRSTSCWNRRRRRTSRWRHWGISVINHDEMDVWKEKPSVSWLCVTAEDACFEISTTIWQLILVTHFFFFFKWAFFAHPPQLMLLFHFQALNTARTLCFLQGYRNKCYLFPSFDV